MPDPTVIREHKNAEKYALDTTVILQHENTEKFGPDPTMIPEHKINAKKTGALAFWPKLRLYRFLRIRPKQLRPMLWPINEAEAPAGARSGGSLFLGSLDAFFRSLASL